MSSEANVYRNATRSEGGSFLPVMHSVGSKTTAVQSLNTASGQINPEVLDGRGCVTSLDKLRQVMPYLV